jgi:enoyl-CoA hydratase/carnithine racemase
MAEPEIATEIDAEIDDGIATVRWSRPPHNFIDADFVDRLASLIEALDREPGCRTIILSAAGKHFCAGADLAGRLSSGQLEDSSARTGHIYEHSRRLVAIRKPMIAAVQGAAVGAGLGLAVLADFRVAAPSSRFSANFVMQGLHPGFGLTSTLPALIGPQEAHWMLCSGVRIDGNEAHRIGLVDRLAQEGTIGETARAMAAALAGVAPLALEATRATLRKTAYRQFKAATAHELAQQKLLRETFDYREGVMAMKERRQPRFEGR